MLRYLFALLLMFPLSAQPLVAESTERSFSDMPVMVLYCDEDPGRLNVGGGKAPAPEELIENGSCRPAEGVALTFVLADDDWDFETDKPADEIEWDVEDDGWFARCDIDATGRCALNSPVGFDIVIGAVLHEGTVLPGYEPAFFQRGTHNFTEFAGYGLALIPGDAATPDATISDHQTLALNITQNGEPASVLTEWEINDKDSDLYLATNADGWVSAIISGGDDISIDLVNIDDDAEISLFCSAFDDPNATVEFAVSNDGDLEISVPATNSDVRCDIQVTS